MQNRVMQRTFIQLATLALLMNLAAHAQSLGDVARENREARNTQDSSSTTKPKIITNADLPKSTIAPQTPNASDASKTADHDPTEQRAADQHAAQRNQADRRYTQQRLAEQRAAAQWKRQILPQKNKVAALQAQIDQIHASIQSANGGVQSQGPFNRYQAWQLQRAAQIQLQLNQQQRKLDQMQDAARRAGMHSAVYDP